MLQITPFQKHHLPFIVLIGILLALIPTASVIEALALKPDYSFSQFFAEGWRLITGHFVHASWSHLLLNLLNIILLRLIFIEWLGAKQLLAFVLFSAIIISIGLWALSDLASYVGFSGIFHGLLCYLLLIYWRNNPFIYGIALACVVGKVIYEQWFGASSALADFIGISIAIDAHALGVASGFLFYVLENVIRNK